MGYNADFDTFWKEMLDLIEPALSFFIPDLHQKVDWSLDYHSLEQELRTILYEGKPNRRRTDKLFKLKLLDGQEEYVLFHTEAEVSPRKVFPQRVYQYHARLSVKFDFIPVTILVIYVGNRPAKARDFYTVSHFGTESTLRFNTYCVAEQSEEALIASENPFALAILANLYVIQSKGDPKKRFPLKRKLVEHLFNRRISLEKFRNMRNFALFLMPLPPEEEAAIKNFIIEQMAHSRNMTGREKFMAQSQSLGDDIAIAIYGETMESMYQQAKETKAAKEAQRKSEEAQRKSEEAQRKSEEAQRKSEEAQRKSEEAQRKSEEAQRKSIINLHSIHKIPAADIAISMGIECSFVEQILKEG